ncbi:Hypothetical protein, conserved [Brucella abortus str. 2308 A]|uniref:Uncharacterized protein n=5 Tax=Brucella TaxID=234 RepID=A0A0F6AR70_BRUA1|nr:hypothetical protein BOV_1225 [Brucella ovis ATCC 25840]ABY38359.1 Hypothetical protein, conserved [Brucella suis ATCC 23445]ACD72700.1 hypothetical protein BAbS19_I11950 [Brucella abortus S19]ACU48245.1 hypothetical protein BMI_I1274 [Brucella microti CCM 4915]ADZ66349.1 conserved hypothetical protein [Brucella melitensis M28]ADZ87209.1 conserved hypothetical protein [Brucella melitensis M5-90]AEK54577.1 hypothetical protein BPI_I1313 [Brucella pinnipedialis B2/94]AEW17586.1 hypothetical
MHRAGPAKVKFSPVAPQYEFGAQDNLKCIALTPAELLSLI